MKKILAGLMLMASMGSAQAVLLTSSQSITFSACGDDLLCSSFSKVRRSFTADILKGQLVAAAGQQFDDVFTFNFDPVQFVPANPNNGVGSGTVQIRWTPPNTPGAQDGNFSAVNFYQDLGPIGIGGADVQIGSYFSSDGGITAFIDSGVLAAGNYYIRAQGQYNATPLANSVQYGTGNLSIQAIPEPSEWALMLSGLGLMGFVARRRRAAATAAA